MAKLSLGFSPHFLFGICNCGVSYDLFQYFILSFPPIIHDDAFSWSIDLISPENKKLIIPFLEVMQVYQRYVKLIDWIDDLFQVHRYTCDKKWSKTPIFYTIHNQKHAIDLIKNIVKIFKSSKQFLHIFEKIDEKA